MSFSRVRSGVNSLNLFVGRKIIRGGRMCKRGAQVVSFSPHLADLLGSASRAAMVGAVALGGAALAHASAGIYVSEATDEAINIVVGPDQLIHNLGGMAVGALAFGQGDIVIVNNGYVISNGEAYDDLGQGSLFEMEGSSGVVALTFGGGTINLTNNKTVVTGDVGFSASRGSDAAGDTIIVNNGIIYATSDDGIGIEVVHHEGANGDVQIRNEGTVAGGALGIFVDHNQSGTITINNAYNSNVGGQEDGIRIERDGNGDVAISNNGAVMGMNGAAIYVARADQSNGNVTVDHYESSDQIFSGAAGITSQSGSGIFIDHGGAGNIAVNTYAGSEIRAGSVGISLGLAESGTVIANLGGSIIANDTGLAIGRANGDTIGNTIVTMTAGSSIDASNYGITIDQSAQGDVSLNLAGSISTGSRASSDDEFREGSDCNTGVYVSHKGDGDLNLTLTGLVDSGFDGVVLYRPGYGLGDLTGNLVAEIGTSGQIIANGIGLATATYREGDTSLTNAGSILASSAGIEITQGGLGDATVSNTGTIVSYDSGIIAKHLDVGNLEISNAGSITSGNYAVAIGADHAGEGDLMITSTGTIQAAGTGIEAIHRGLGELAVLNSGTLTRVYNNVSLAIEVTESGIYGRRSDSGNMDLVNSSTGVITGFEVGILADQVADGDLLIRNDGTINGAEFEVDDITYLGGNGIYAKHDAIGDISIINNGSIVVGYVGIEADHFGEGDMLIQNAGSITARFGIVASQTSGGAVGNIAIVSTGNIATSAGDGIYAEAQSGHISIVANNVTAVDGVGIIAENDSDSGVSIVTAGLVQGDYSAISALANGGDVDITIGQNSVVQHISGETNARAIDAGSYLDDRTSINVVNNGTVNGTVQFSNVGWDDSVSLINNGKWDSTGGFNTFDAGENTVIVNGVWTAVGSQNSFNDSVSPDGNKVVIGANGRLLVGTVEAGPVMLASTFGPSSVPAAMGTSFTGLGLLEVGGLFSSANGVVGDLTTTDGDIIFKTGSVFEVDTGPNNTSDLLRADGVVTIEGGTLRVAYAGAGAPTIGNFHTILSGSEVIGRFTNTEVMNTAFLGWDINYFDDQVEITYAKLRKLNAAGKTRNQIGTADAVESLGVTNALAIATLNLADDKAAQTAFNLLSGEIHPGVRTAMMESSRLQRNAVLDRLQTPQGGAVWGQMFFNKGHNNGLSASGTAKLERESWGFIAGADVALGEDAVFGLAASFNSDDLKQSARAASGSGETIHALAYVGGQAGRLNYKAGAGYAWSSFDTIRNVTVGSFSDRLTANYDAKLFQSFAEVDVNLPIGKGQLEPFANFTYLNAKTDGFVEKGGLAALTADAESESRKLTTLGSRFTHALGGALSVRATLGWQHVYGALAPSTGFNFKGGSDFSTAGAAQSRDAAVAKLEANIDLSANTALGISYDGNIGSESVDHSGKVSLRVKF